MRRMRTIPTSIMMRSIITTMTRSMSTIIMMKMSMNTTMRMNTIIMNTNTITTMSIGMRVKARMSTE